ncbi:MAG: NAD-dependent epimerase/dehydratase family protein [Candidatus Methanofastidiosia archaeon]
MKVLVSGATGLVGSHLVEKILEKGLKVKALVRKTSDLSHLKKLKVDLVFGDLENFKTLKKATENVDLVYHAAAKILGENFKDFYQTNVIGTENLLKASLESGVSRFIFLSTVSVYGSRNIVDGKEELERKATSHYGRSKVLAEDLVMKYHFEKNLKVSIARPRAIYGERDRYYIPSIVKLSEKRIPLISGGKNLWDSIYVKDLCEALWLMAKKEKANGQAYNVTDGEKRTVFELIHTAQDILGVERTEMSIPYSLALGIGALFELKNLMRRNRDLIFTRSRIKSLCRDRNFNISKVKRELGFEPKYSLKEGLRRGIGWYKKNKV